MPGGARTAALLRRAAAEDALWLDARGTSMGPTIRSGARVLVRPGRVPTPGSVWAFCDDSGSVLVHRFVRVDDDGALFFRGDARVKTDRPVPVEHLIGEVVEIEWRGRRTQLPADHAGRRALRSLRRAGAVIRSSMSPRRRAMRATRAAPPS